MTVDANSFIDDSFNDGEWSPEQAAQYLEMSMNGDTSQGESIETPADTAANEQTTEPEDKDDTPTPETITDKPDNNATSNDDAEVDGEKVVLARDGVHTIPYEKLVEARERDRVSQEALAAANAELESLRKQLQTPATVAPTQQEQDIETAQAAIDAGVNPELFGDFSEEALAKGIKELVAADVQAQVAAQVKAQVAEALKPMQAREQESAEAAHYRTIYEAHQDIDSILESGEFETWKAAQPSYVQDALDGVLTQGTAKHVVELLNNYKQSTNSTADPARADKLSTDDLKAKAREAIKNAAPPIPASLSDIPGGHKGVTDIREQMESMSGIELVDAMSSWTPEKREQYLNNL